MNDGLKKEILSLLKIKDRATSEISANINRNHYYTLKLLEELKKENKISNSKKGKYIYWSLK